jgi:hypothetical protein
MVMDLVDLTTVCVPYLCIDISITTHYVNNSHQLMKINHEFNTYGMARGRHPHPLPYFEHSN